MFGKRRWSLWPRRFADQLGSVTGLTGVFGISLGSLALSGGIISDNTPVIILGIIILAIGVAAITVCIWGSIPVRLLDPADFVGQEISDEQLENMSAPLYKVGIVGVEQTGKSTLLNSIRPHEYPTRRTTRLYRHIVTVPTIPDRYIVCLDAGGFEDYQQFQVTSQSDFLFILVDHNISHDTSHVDPSRIDQHSAFLERVRNYIRSGIEPTGRKISWIHMLLNKKDLWESATEEDRRKLLDFFQKEILIWKEGEWSIRFTSADYSNRLSDNANAFFEQISKFIDSQR